MFRHLVPTLAVAARASTVVRAAPAARRALSSSALRLKSDASSAPKFTGPAAAIARKPAATATAAASEPVAAARVDELMEEMEVLKDELVLEGTATEVISVPAASTFSTASAATAALPERKSAVAADMDLFVTMLRNKEAARQRELTGTSDDAHASAGVRNKRLENPLIPADHPLLTDDFALLTPFATPSRPTVASIFGPLTLPHREFDADADEVPEAHEAAAASLMNHANFPYLLAPGLPLLPGGPTPIVHSDALVMELMSPAGAGELPAGFLDHTRAPGAEGAVDGMYMTSVLRKRRKKMNKHKLRKLRKRTRSQRK
ncbi:hypothetical protein H9P43_009597 [Blastocladiella emersonii ATCC 22665]|nr:hypothetical protein H9P43_009597 [Blastocladiella emersonii ATCC 22665]